MAKQTKTTRAASSHPETIARISPARPARPAGGRGLHLRHAQEPVLRPLASSSSSTASTSPGDDIRHLDWKVWSKTDRFYIKQYEAETNLRCHVVVDVSESMHYGTTAPQAARSTSTSTPAPSPPAWRTCCCTQQDAVRAASRSTRTCGRSCRRAARSTHIDAVVKALHVSRPREKTDILKILRRVAESMPSRGMVVDHLRPPRATASRCSRGWRCSGTAGTTSWSSTSWTTTN